jgi:hypothetical protein
MTRSRMRIGAVTLVVGLVASACDSSSPSASTPAGTTAPSVAVDSSPTIGPAVDVVPLFAAAMNDVKSGAVALDGTARVGNIQFTMSGSQVFSGPDSTGSITTAIGGVATTVETTQVGGKRYTRTGDGPWVEAPARAGSDLMDEILKNAGSSLSDVGTETRDGRLVHRLEVAGSAFDPAALLSSAAGVSDAEGSVAFYCTDDGTPVGAQIELTWQQKSGDQAADASMSFEVSFSQLGVDQTIRAPDEVWSVHTSPRYEYSIAYPSDYDFTKDKDYDYFFAPDLDFMGVSRVTNQGLSLNVITGSEVESIKAYINARRVTNEAITLGGLEGRWLTATGSNADLGKVLVHEVIVVKGQWLYFVAWFSKPGKEAADKATFLQVVSSFAFK